MYPPQVVAELARYVQPKSPDPQFTWAKGNASAAHSIGNCSLDEVKEVLIEVPDVLDPDKDAGEDEADLYVLAVARKLRDDGIDARVITEERRDTNRKISVNTAPQAFSAYPLFHWQLS